MSVFEFDQELYDQVQREDAWEEGMAQGMARGMEMMNTLVSKLMKDGRLDEFLLSVGNKAAQEALMKEYCL